VKPDLKTKLAAGEKVPQGAATFELAVKLAPSANDQKGRKFAGKANSGGVMPGHWYWGNLAIDMAGLQIGRMDKPVLFEHDACEPLGYTTSITAGPDGIDVEGVLLDVTEKGQEIIALLAAGMPLQMSIFAPPSEVLILQEGESAQVNGKPITGPGAIFTNSTLREVTITTLGVDEGTCAALLSAASSFSTSVRERQTKMTNQDPNAGGTPAPAPAPASAAQLAQAKLDAAAAERARVLAVTKLGAGLPAEIVEKAITDGLDQGAAAMLFLDAERKGKESRLAAIRKTTPEASGVDDPDEVKKFSEKDAKAPAAPTAKLSTVEEAKAKFAASQELQDEFPTEADYVAFAVHEAKAARRGGR